MNLSRGMECQKAHEQDQDGQDADERCFKHVNQMVSE